MPDACIWLGPPWLNLSFSLALTIYGSLAILFSFLCDDTLHKLGNIHVVIDSLVICALIVWGGWVLCLVLVLHFLVAFHFCNHLVEEK